MSVTDQVKQMMEDYKNLQKEFARVIQENEEKDLRIQGLEQELTYESDQCENLIDENEKLKKELEMLKKEQYRRRKTDEEDEMSLSDIEKEYPLFTEDDEISRFASMTGYTVEEISKLPDYSITELMKKNSFGVLARKRMMKHLQLIRGRGSSPPTTLYQLFHQ